MNYDSPIFLENKLVFSNPGRLKLRLAAYNLDLRPGFPNPARSGPTAKGREGGAAVSFPSKAIIVTRGLMHK